MAKGDAPAPAQAANATSAGDYKGPVALRLALKVATNDTKMISSELMKKGQAVNLPSGSKYAIKFEGWSSQFNAFTEVKLDLFGPKVTTDNSQSGSASYTVEVLVGDLRELFTFGCSPQDKSTMNGLVDGMSLLGRG